MRICSASDEEALRMRDLLKDWAGEGLIAEAQYQRMERETVCDLRRTNVFLRLVLFLFTMLIVGGAAGLFFVVFLSRPSPQTTGAFLLIFAAISYAGAEIAVSQARLYRYGIEEALAVCSVGLLCVGMQAALQEPGGAEWLVPATGTIASLWIWRRFGLSYAFLAAMIFVVFLPNHWTSSHSTQHVIVALLYAVGLAGFALTRTRDSLAEALLWFGIYLAINLQLSSLNLLPQWWNGRATASEFSRPFYWTTWVLIWCLPPAILARGVRRKDRFVIAAGAIAAILTLVTNKPYLGWQRHTWDPMLLGALLIGVALWLRRWFAEGQGGVRYGFTAQRLSGKDKQRMNAVAGVFGLASPQSITPAPQAGSHEVRFGGGDSAGGGASSDF